MTDKNIDIDAEIKLANKILSNKKIFKRFLIMLAVAGMIALIVFVPCSYEGPKGRKIEKKSPIADGKGK